MWWIVPGFILGVVSVVPWALLVASKRQSAPADGCADVKARLALARKRLGYIATRTSINEARKIANKTLKELKE